MQVKFCFKENGLFPDPERSLAKISQIIYEKISLKNKAKVKFSLAKNKNEFGTVIQCKLIENKPKEELIWTLGCDRKGELFCFKMQVAQPQLCWENADLDAIKDFFYEAFAISRQSRDLSIKVTRTIPNYEEVSNRLVQHQLAENNVLTEILNSLVI